jgi:RHS repeat-associated protein
VTETIGDKTLVTKMEYDALGREQKYVYPSGYTTTNWYDTNGILTAVTDNKNRSLWKPLQANAKGQVLRKSRGGIITNYGYDGRGFPDSISSPGIIRMAYSFNDEGNLDYRQDNLTNQKELFTYDGLNRLTAWDVYYNNVLTKLNSQTYNATTGNIATRSDLNNLSMGYGLDGRPHSLDSIAGVPEIFPTSDLSVTYTDFKKIKTLSEGNKLYTLTYGVDDQRRKSVYQTSGVTRQTHYYIGDYEEEVDANGNIRKIHYLGGGVVLIRNNGTDSLLYGYTDNQSSLIALTDESGTVLERYAYDPWGNRRNPEDWSQSDTRTHWLTNRGYTMHEHLDAFGIINMNGRVYDPLTGMFFSPDPYVQAPEDWLNYNRYSYCVNNPLKYTDPSGEFFLGTILTFVGDALKTAFIDGGLDPTSKSARQSAWRDFDPTASWSPTNKAWKIDMGSFKTDPNRNFWGRSWQLISRWTWELPQTVLGKEYSHIRNMTGNVDDVSYYGGATLVNKNDKSGDEWGLTLGPYINSKNMEADPYRDPVFRHEYGHTLQSRLVGPLYLTSVGLPSLIGGFLDYNLGISNHDREWYETQANRMSERYFSNHDPGALTALPWDDNNYPREYKPEWYWIFAHPSPAFMWWLFF